MGSKTASRFNCQTETKYWPQKYILPLGLGHHTQYSYNQTWHSALNWYCEELGMSRDLKSLLLMDIHSFGPKVLNRICFSLWIFDQRSYILTCYITPWWLYLIQNLTGPNPVSNLIWHVLTSVSIKKGSVGTSSTAPAKTISLVRQQFRRAIEGM